MIRIWFAVLSILCFVLGIGANPSTNGAYYSARVEQVRTMALAASRRIVCDTDEGESHGTGFFISPTRMITAAHVIQEGVCFIEGEGAARIVEINPDLDFAIVQPVHLTPNVLEPTVLRTTCRETSHGQLSYSTGFARGQEFTVLRGNRIEEAGPTDRLTVLSIRGMSGGPVIDDQTERVIGWVISIRRGQDLTNFGELSMTTLCR